MDISHFDMKTINGLIAKGKVSGSEAVEWCIEMNQYQHSTGKVFMFCVTSRKIKVEQEIDIDGIKQEIHNALCVDPEMFDDLDQSPVMEVADMFNCDTQVIRNILKQIS